MAIKDILAKIIDLGEEKGYISYKSIKDLDKSCCSNNNLEVIDFDFFKDKFISKKELQHFQSCDALKIVETRLDFIEMKGFKELLVKPNIPAEHKTKSKIANDIDNFGIATKIKDSLLLWDTFIKEKDALKGHEVRDLENTLTFRFMLLTDVEHNDADWFAINLNFLAEYNETAYDFLYKKLNKQLTDIDPTLIARIKTLPKLMTCTEIDDYYATV